MVNKVWMIPSTMLVIYACTVMYLLLDVHLHKLTQKRRLGGILFFVAFIICNISAQAMLGYQVYGKFYLLFTQLPVYLLFRLVSNYKGIKLLFVLLTTVFFSSPIMMVTSVLRHFFELPIWTYIVFYIMFLVLIHRYFKGAFNHMLAVADNRLFFVFITIPLMYYIYGYALTQYQLADMVINTRFFVLQIPWLIVLVAYLLLVQIFKMVFEKAELQNAKNLASVQLNAATKQIEQLRMSQKEIAIYRHDLRHHMNYLNACIVENKLQEATAYIQQTCVDIENMKLEQYSGNEPLNLLLSAYVSKAREQGIAIEIGVSATEFGRFQIPDLCSLISNALENAIKACVLIENPNQRYIKLRMYEKSNKLCLSIRNNYRTEPVFEEGVPIASHEGHGIGVKSIVHVVEKYEGVYGFSAKNGVFLFQMSM